MSRRSKLKKRKEERIKGYKAIVDKLMVGGAPSHLPKRFRGFTKPGSGKHY